jgi:mannosyltransferase
MPRTTMLWLAGLTALAAALRFPTLDLQSFWTDESFTALLVRRDFGDMLSAIPDSESTPPLYYVLAWTWAKLFGGWEVGLRSLSALCGTALVPAVYAMTVRVVPPRAGLAAAALTAVNPLLVWYSQEARAYALLLLLCALSVLFLLPALEGWRGRDLVLWGVASALALGTHYFAAFLVVPEAVWLLLAAHRAGRLRRAGAAAGLPTLAALTLAPLAVDQRSNRFADYIGETGLGTRVAQLPKQLLVGFDAPAEVLVSALALALAAVGLGLAIRRTISAERRRLLPMGALALAAVGLPAALALAGVDYLNTRNVIAVWLPLAVILGAGFGAQGGGRLALGSLVALAAVCVGIVVAVSATDRYQREDWRGASEALGPAESDRVIVSMPLNSQRPLELYAGEMKRLPQPAHASAVAVVTVAQRDGGERRAPRLPDFEAVGQFTAAQGFSQTERRATDSYGLIRLASGAPVELFDWELGFLVPPGQSAEFLLQRAGGPPADTGRP